MPGGGVCPADIFNHTPRGSLLDFDGWLQNTCLMTVCCRLAALSLLALSLAAGCNPRAQDNAIIMVGTVERDRMEMLASVTELLAELPVREGQTVPAGTVVARLDDTRLKEEIASLRHARDAEKAKLDELEAGFRSEDIAQARAGYQSAVARAEIAAIEFQRARTLVAQAVETQALLDSAKSTLDAAEADKRKAAENLREFETGPRSEDIRAQRASYEAAGARLREAEVRHSQLSLIAPRACRVDVLPFRVGERVPANASVATLLDLEKPYARVFVPERAGAVLLPGREGTAKADGVAREFKVRVRTVSREANFTPFYALTDRERGRLSFAAKMDLIEPEARELPVGVPVTVKFSNQ